MLLNQEAKMRNTIRLIVSLIIAILVVLVTETFSALQAVAQGNDTCP